MLRSDANEIRGHERHLSEQVEAISINIDVISEIEKEFQDNPYDLTSLVFLLYEVPDTALQRLIVYQRVSKDLCSTNLNLLQEWFRYAKSKPHWKQEFVEALLICQLFSILRKLGFNVAELKKHYQPDNIFINMYINPIKKLLYRICENMDDTNLKKLKKTLLTYKIDTSEYDTCELIFLSLMCRKFITVNQLEYNKTVCGVECDMTTLIKILENMNGMQNFALDLHKLQDKMDSSKECPPSTSTPVNSMHTDEKHCPKNYDNKNLTDVFNLFNDLNLDDCDDDSDDGNESDEKLKSDTKKIDKDCYPIKDQKKLGVCIIINQEEFHPSLTSIQNEELTSALESRVGSERDKRVLEKTMESYNLKVVSRNNLDHVQIFELIKNVIKNSVSENDSIFMLCILSHGVRGHIYGADSVKVKVDDIQKLLDSDFASCLRDIPKVLIIQACQIDETPQKPIKFVADGVHTKFVLHKLDYLIYWATAPEYEAYRHEQKGSLFIQILCKIIRRQANKEDLSTIFTKTTDHVISYCQQLEKAQVPIFKSTLRKKLYLKPVK